MQVDRPAGTPYVPWLTLAAGWMLLLCGAAVMAGWVMGQPTVMDAGSHLATVWFSTALGIALAGVPLIALGREYRRISIWAATALALVSLVALAESVFHVSSGLDTWRLPQGDLTPGPGRTSSITAIACFWQRRPSGCSRLHGSSAATRRSSWRWVPCRCCLASPSCSTTRSAAPTCRRREAPSDWPPGRRRCDRARAGHHRVRLA